MLPSTEQGLEYNMEIQYHGEVERGVFHLSIDYHSPPGADHETHEQRHRELVERYPSTPSEVEARGRLQEMAEAGNGGE